MLKDCRQIHALTFEILKIGDYLRSVKIPFTNSEHKCYERRVKALQLIEKNVTPDTKKYLLMLCTSGGNILSFCRIHNPKNIRRC